MIPPVGAAGPVLLLRWVGGRRFMVVHDIVHLVHSQRFLFARSRSSLGRGGIEEKDAGGDR